MSLRKISVLLGSIFFVAVTAVAWLLFRYTNLIETKAIAITSSAESIKAAEELEVQLLRINREALLSSIVSGGNHSFNRRQAEDRVKYWLEVSKQFVSSPYEKAVLDEVERTINDFIKVRRDLDNAKLDPVQAYIKASRAVEPALRSVNKLTELNLNQARDLGREAEIENRNANVQAALIAFICILVFPALWLIVQRWVYDPIHQLSRGIVEFRLRKTPVRIPISGIKEIREIAASFNELTDDLANQRRMQLRFLAGVAHDLRNPLGAIRMSAELLNAEKMPEDEQHSMVDIISRQALHLDRMVGDLLETNRIESGELEIKKQKQDVVTLIRDAIILHRPLSSLHHIDFDYSGSPVFCMCDPLRISQVLNNILSNAIKYSPNGGRILVRLLTDAKDAINIKVSDEGIGIASEDQARIFEPFRRTKLTKETIPGVGLGLSVVKRIIEAHDGTIEVKSRLGEGTEFSIKIPREHEANKLPNKFASERRPIGQNSDSLNL